MKRTTTVILSLLTMLCVTNHATANNISITDLSLVAADAPGCVDVQATVSWDNSWRAAWTELAD